MFEVLPTRLENVQPASRAFWIVSFGGESGETAAAAEALRTALEARAGRGDRAQTGGCLKKTPSRWLERIIPEIHANFSKRMP